MRSTPAKVHQHLLSPAQPKKANRQQPGPTQVESCPLKSGVKVIETYAILDDGSERTILLREA